MRWGTSGVGSQLGAISQPGHGSAADDLDPEEGGARRLPGHLGRPADLSLNRLVQTLLPLLMGGVVDLIGLEASFIVTGGVLLLIVGSVMFVLSRRGMMPRGSD